LIGGFLGGDLPHDLFDVSDSLLDIFARGILLASILGEAGEEVLGIGSSGDDHAVLECLQSHLDGSQTEGVDLGWGGEGETLVGVVWYFAHRTTSRSNP